MNMAFDPDPENDLDPADPVGVLPDPPQWKAPNILQCSSGELLLTAARIEAEEPGRGHNAAADPRRATELAEQVRTVVPAAMQEIGAGGELVPTTAQDENAGALELRNTVESPDYVAADASRARLEMANRAGVLEAALDAADTIGAQNSLEKMLAHQLAATHQAAMKMAKHMNRRLDRLEHMSLGHDSADRMTVEACRLANTMARMSAAYQQGLLTLQRLRTDGSQRIVVQHVTVEDGGQAVVAGEMKTRGQGQKGKRQGGSGGENGQ